MQRRELLEVARIRVRAMCQQQHVLTHGRLCGKCYLGQTYAFVYECERCHHLRHRILDMVQIMTMLGSTTVGNKEKAMIRGGINQATGKQ